MKLLCFFMGESLVNSQYKIVWDLLINEKKCTK